MIQIAEIRILDLREFNRIGQVGDTVVKNFSVFSIQAIRDPGEITPLFS